MITLVTGSAGSGKSLFAEGLAMKYPGNRYYIATMKVMDEEGMARVKKHRSQRAGKGFVTLEIPVAVDDAPKLMDSPQNSVVLLECAANLAGNMMHDVADIGDLCKCGGDGIKEAAGQVAAKIEALSGQVSHLYVVTSVYDIDSGDDEETVIYKKLLEQVNITLQNMADKVFERPDDMQTGGAT